MATVTPGEVDQRLLVVSSDDHAGPPIEDYRSYIAVRHHDAFDRYVALVHECDRRTAEYFDSGAKTGRNEDLVEMLKAGNENTASEDPEAGLVDATAHLGYLDSDGITAGVVFPQGSPAFYPYPANVTFLPAIDFPFDGELRVEGAAAYNRWLADFCGVDPVRLRGVAVIPIFDVDAAVVEVRRAHAAGLRAISLPPMSERWPFYNDAVYEPLWAVCAELGMGLCLHGASTVMYEGGPQTMAYVFAECDFFVRRALPFLLFSGVFDRYPSLTVSLTEQRAGWGAVVRDDWDSIFLSPASGLQGFLGRKPSEYFGENVFIGASFMSRGETELRHEIGVDALMWGSDYPHVEGTWPQTALSLRKTFAGVPLDEVRQMVGENAIRCYGLDRDALREVADRIGPTYHDINQPYHGGAPEGLELSWGFREHGAWS